MAKYRWLTILSLSFIIFHFSFSPVLAQIDRQLVRQGNKLYRSGDFANAEVSYRKALEKNDRNPQARYNLGNSLLAQNKDSAAVAEFEKAAKAEPNELRKSMAYHNMGVICQRHQMFGEAIEAYKQSLRLNPKDDQTRYNLELCKRQQKQQQNNNQQNQQNQDNKDKNKQDQQKQQQQKQDEQKQQEQQKKQQEPKMSKDNAEQLLNAAMQQEKQTQERMKKAQQKPQKRNIEKNW
jgi:Ca-activated chloride channel family protein